MASEYDEKYFIKTRNITGVLLNEKRPLWKRWVKVIQKLIPSGRLLDIGCGEGYFLEFAERYYETYGMDISEYCIKEAMKRTKKSRLSQGDIFKLNYSDEYFDVVTCFDILEHVENYDSAVDECKRILKEEGIFVVRVPNTSSFGLKWKKQNWFAYKDKTHVSLLHKKVWLELLEKHGFEIKEIIYDGLWDTPYLSHVPNFLQTLLIKIPSILLFYVGGNLPEGFGENVCIIAQRQMTSK
jgi:2-polyprenyl-3-methyl-5-hydroxy-6-metoxy-1,4-benzoquinol methylase